MRIKLSKPMTLSEIAGATGSLIKNKNKYRAVSYLTTDTREIQPEDLFVCLRGERFDGENFAREALKKGALVMSRYDRKNGLIAQDTRVALLRLGAYSKALLKNLKKTVAITGSVGKTTTKEFTKCILQTGFKVCATEGNLNNEIGVSLTLLSAPQDTELMVVEMGMNSSGEISRLAKAVRPDIGVITCIGTSHIGRLGSRKNIALAKLEVLDGMENGKLVIPGGEPLLNKVDNGFKFSAALSSADLYIQYIRGNARVKIKGEDVFEASFLPLGKHNLECLGASISASYLSGLDINNIKTGISNISVNNTRQNIININEFYILDDSYNSSYESLTAAFDLLCDYKDYTAKSVVIGDILELGKASRDIYRAIGLRLTKYGFKSIFLVGECCEIISDTLIKNGYAGSRIHTNPDAMRLDITAGQILKLCERGELILIKASHGLGLSKLAEIILRQTEDKNG